MPAKTTAPAKSMDIDILDLFEKRARVVEVTLGDEPGETFTVRYKPDAYSKSMIARVQNLEDESETPAEVLEELLTGWSLKSGGKPYPLTRENIDALGYLIQIMTLNAVQADYSGQDVMGKVTSNALPQELSTS
jgi:hypothetical protein